MITILLSVFLLCLLFGLLYWVVQMLPFPNPFKQIALAVLALIAVLIIAGWLFGWTPLPQYGHLR